jgi:hypothetical protein
MGSIGAGRRRVSAIGSGDHMCDMADAGARCVCCVDAAVAGER